MRKLFVKFILLFTIVACTNTPDLETGEIKTLNLLKDMIYQPRNKKIFVDSRNLLSREQIDAADIPVLFVELDTGQNGTLTPYPGQGFGETWLGADGATITLEQGIVKASRGMGDDIMGSSSSMPKWSKINQNTKVYSRKVSHITGNNKISERKFECKIQKNNQKEVVKIWDVKFSVTKFEEHCNHYGFKIKNIYYVDHNKVVRKSLQFHGDTIGYISTERLDR